MTVIAFVGSVFSPYYAWKRRRGPENPLEHCAFNVALYGPGGRWAMTERGSQQVDRGTSELSIGPSHMRWSGDVLEIHIDETCAPLPKRVKGTVRLIPHWTSDHAFPLDAAGRHSWTPIAPCARIEARFTHPRLEWSGMGYADGNRGEEPLEDAFSYWTWSRSGTPASPVVLYDVTARDLTSRNLSLKFSPNGSMQEFEPPPTAALPNTGWQVARSTRADVGTAAIVIDTLEDAPFYSRSLLSTQVAGERACAIHESLDLERFRRYWVQCLLPFRMPRVTRRSRIIR